MAEASSRDADASVRQRAVETLARVAGDRALRLARSRKTEPFVRYEALVNLAEIGDSRVAGLLQQALDDPHELISARLKKS
jgi:HEAT repeat protein